MLKIYPRSDINPDFREDGGFIFETKKFRLYYGSAEAVSAHANELFAQRAAAEREKSLKDMLDEACDDAKTFAQGYLAGLKQANKLTQEDLDAATNRAYDGGYGVGYADAKKRNPFVLDEEDWKIIMYLDDIGPAVQASQVVKPGFERRFTVHFKQLVAWGLVRLMEGETGYLAKLTPAGAHAKRWRIAQGDTTS